MSSDRAPSLCLTMGDPAGCGPQITISAWKALRETGPVFCVAAPPSLYDAPVAEIASPDEAAGCFARALPVLKLDAACPAVCAGAPDAAAAPAILASIRSAVALARDGRAAGVVTNPINKALLYGAGFGHPGHTEFIASLCAKNPARPPRPVMMLVGGGLRVALATIHMPLKDVAGALTKHALIEIVQIVDRDLRARFGLPRPRIAFSGLNPHAGEAGALGGEEIEIINPAAAAARADGLDVSDARPGDTVFNEALDGRFDAVIAMTHDQGLIPVKVLDFWGGVNTTLGLPIIRTSPDHGTAYAAAAAGTARADSLIAAIRLAGEMAQAETSTEDA